MFVQSEVLTKNNFYAKKGWALTCNVLNAVSKGGGKFFIFQAMPVSRAYFLSENVLNADTLFKTMKYLLMSNIKDLNPGD